MTDWHYLNNDQQRIGPVDEAEIYRLLDVGTLSASSLVWRPEMGSEWRPIYESDLRGALKPPPPPNSSQGMFPSTQMPATSQAGRGFLKLLAWIVGIPVVFFILYSIVFIISEAVSDTQYYATSIGMSVRECRNTMQADGVSYFEASKKCAERIPKTVQQ